MASVEATKMCPRGGPCTCESTGSGDCSSGKSSVGCNCWGSELDISYTVVKIKEEMEGWSWYLRYVVSSG